MIKHLFEQRRRLKAALVSVTLGLAPHLCLAQGVITQTEPNDSIGTAIPTGITAGSSILKVSYGHSGDGPYGETGDMSGDVDFFKLSANAGQKIFVNMANGGIDADFDAYAAVYNSTGTVLAESDDKGDTPRGYDRTPLFTYTVPAAGDYYICVSNWVQDTTSLPSNPLTPGTGPGLASGNSGPYQIVIGLDAELPAVQFVGGVSGYPVPAFLPEKIFGTPRREGLLTIYNRSTGTTPAAELTITAFNLTGPDASRYFVRGLLPPVTIPAGGRLDVPIAFNAVGMGNSAQATLNFTSNDPLNSTFSLNTYSPVEGGGLFQVKQVNAPAGTAVNSFEVADQLLDGTIVGTVTTGTTSRINYGAGAAGHFGSDLPFISGGTAPDNIVIQVTGPINIRTTGTYTFVGFSDDGQRLRIDGNEVFSYTGYDRDTFGSVELTAGVHQIEYTMYEGGGGNHAELSMTQQAITIGSFVSATWELVEAAGTDTDNDGMPDAYESANGLSPTSASGNDGPAGDPDADNSSNANEYYLGTNPQQSDSDSDGLSDGAESGTGVWVSVTNSGTDPLNPDTDRDGLFDGVENPGLPSTGFAQPGTSPLLKDTDGDSYADGSEIALGTSPISGASVPAPVFKPLLSENFDGASFHSSYTINQLNVTGTFVPGVADSGDAAHSMTAQLTAAVNSLHNTISWDYVDGPAAGVVRIALDYRIGSNGGVITDPADGFGIGLFRKSAYGTSGASPAIVTAKAWENPAPGGGYADALFFGFGVYGTDSIRVLTPAAPATPLAVVNPTFPLLNDLFNRVIITVISNTPTSSMLKLEMIMDVDGAAPVTRTIFDNVLVPGFVISSEDVRIIAGARTGGAYAPIEIDNVSLSIPQAPDPVLALSNTFSSFLADVHDGSASTAEVNPASVSVTLNGSPVTVTTGKTGGVTTVSYPGTAGMLFPSGTNTLVFSWTSTTGAPYTETRTFTVPAYRLLPPALAVPATKGFIPGFAVTTKQLVPVTAGQTFPGSIDYAEALWAGAYGGRWTPGVNDANLSLADENGVFLPLSINFEQAAGAAGYFTGDVNTPGIPGLAGGNDNYIIQALTWMEFPAAGLYTLGVNADDGYRLSVGHAPVAPLLAVTFPAASAGPVAAVASVLGEGGNFGPLPSPPIVRRLVHSVPAIADTALTNAAAISGNIALIERGVVAFAVKIKNAQDAGAAGVIIYNNAGANETVLPFSMGGDGTGITIPGIMVSRADGLALAALAAAPGGAEVSYGSDRSGTLGFANPNAITSFNVAVSTPGLYPLRFLNFEGGGGANAELYSVDALNVRHLVNDANDAASLRAWAALTDGNAAILMRAVNGELLFHFKGTLQESENLGSFTDILGAPNPYVVPAGMTGRKFFRAKP